MYRVVHAVAVVVLGVGVEREVQAPEAVVADREVVVLHDRTVIADVPARGRAVRDLLSATRDASRPELELLVPAAEHADVEVALRRQVHHAAERQRDALGELLAVVQVDDDAVVDAPPEGGRTAAGAADSQQVDAVESLVGRDHVTRTVPRADEPPGLLVDHALSGCVAAQAVHTVPTGTSAAVVVVAADHVATVRDALDRRVFAPGRVVAHLPVLAQIVATVVDHGVAVIVDAVANFVLAVEDLVVARGAVRVVLVAVTVHVAVTDVADAVLVQVGLVRVRVVDAVVVGVEHAVVVRVVVHRRAGGRHAGVVFTDLVTVAVHVAFADDGRIHAGVELEAAHLPVLAVVVGVALHAVNRGVGLTVPVEDHEDVVRVAVLVGVPVAVVVEAVATHLEGGATSVGVEVAARGAAVVLVLDRTRLTPHEVAAREVLLNADGDQLGHPVTVDIEVDRVRTTLLVVPAVRRVVARAVAVRVVGRARAAVHDVQPLARLGGVVEHLFGADFLRRTAVDLHALAIHAPETFATGCGLDALHAPVGLLVADVAVALGRHAVVLELTVAAARDGRVVARVVGDQVLGADLAVVAGELDAGVVRDRGVLAFEAAELVRRALIAAVAAVDDQAVCALALEDLLPGAHVAVFLARDLFAEAVRANRVVVALGVTTALHAGVRLADAAVGVVVTVVVDHALGALLGPAVADGTVGAVAVAGAAARNGRVAALVVGRSRHDAVRRVIDAVGNRLTCVVHADLGVAAVVVVDAAVLDHLAVVAATVDDLTTPTRVGRIVTHRLDAGARIPVAVGVRIGAVVVVDAAVLAGHALAVHADLAFAARLDAAVAVVAVAGLEVVTTGLDGVSVVFEFAREGHATQRDQDQKLRTIHLAFLRHQWVVQPEIDSVQGPTGPKSPNPGSLHTRKILNSGFPPSRE